MNNETSEYLFIRSADQTNLSATFKHKPQNFLKIHKHSFEKSIPFSKTFFKTASDNQLLKSQQPYMLLTCKICYRSKVYLIFFSNTKIQYYFVHFANCLLASSYNCMHYKFSLWSHRSSLSEWSPHPHLIFSHKQTHILFSQQLCLCTSSLSVCTMTMFC